MPYPTTLFFCMFTSYKHPSLVNITTSMDHYKYQCSLQSYTSVRKGPKELIDEVDNLVQRQHSQKLIHLIPIR